MSAMAEDPCKDCIAWGLPQVPSYRVDSEQQVTSGPIFPTKSLDNRVPVQDLRLVDLHYRR